MSAEQDNKAFVTGVLSNTGIDFSKATFGIWRSSFQHINYGNPTVNSGYSYPRPLVEDLASAAFSITGQTFNFVSLDGKSPAIKFFLTSGVKGINGYESLVSLVELSSSYFSGLKPVVVLPDMDFPGKLYRRYEATGLVKSSITRNNILAVSGEDWEELPNSISANNTDQEYIYEDANYSGYSNQSVARYKFLYTDSGNSIPQDFYEFEFPFQLEASSIVKYRVSRRSDPVGSFEIPYFTADGKAIIDYSQYKEEISGALEGGVYYNFNPVKTVSCTKEEAQGIFNDGNVLIKSLTGQNNTNESITGVKFYKQENGGVDYLQFDLLSTGEYSGIYKASVSVNRFLLNKKENVEAYVMTGFNLGDGNDVKINLAVNDQVYPRLIEDGRPYSYNEVAPIVDFEEVLANEQNLQDLSVDPPDETTDEETSVLADTIEENFAALARALNDDFGEENVSTDLTTDIVAERAEQDAEDISALISENSRSPVQKSLVPNYPLPKKTYSSDYFSNYVNSGESYVLMPLSEYTLSPSFAAYGNEYGRIGYYLSEDEKNKVFRSVINTTAKGVYINEQGFCDGQSALYAPPNRFSDGSVVELNGTATQIPSDGLIKKSNYYKEDSWKNALNYFYAKNYVASFDVYPSFSQEDYDGLFSQVFTQVKTRIGGPNPNIGGQDSFYLNQGTLGARIFVEREIYTENYNPSQIEELNASVAGGNLAITGLSQAGQIEEKLYCVQSYDASDFTSDIPKSFYPAQAYREIFAFDELIPDSSFVYSSYSESKISTFYTGENATVGNLYFEDKNFNPKRVFRPEYVTGSASSFTYANYSNAAIWNGVNGGTISIPSPDLEKYSYHLFEYTGPAEMKLVKSNVKNNEIATITQSNATVLKFQKFSIVGKAIIFQGSDGNTYHYINAAPQYSNGNLVDADKVKFNIQAYRYDVTCPSQDLDWVVFNGNPINNNIYGIRGGQDQKSIPRFFQDDEENTKNIASTVVQFPNGPYTSKNYEGTPVKEQNLNALKNGLFDNLIKVREEDGTEFEYESNCTLDVAVNGILEKGYTPEQASIPNNWISFDSTRRLKITRVRYNFYVKDLVIVGDAGFSYSSEYNNGWEYKLQYRKTPDTAWKTMGSVSSFSVDKFGSINVTPSPYFYKLPDFNTLNYLGIVAFRTNLPLFLDDNDFEFRIAKYEKLTLFSNTVNVIKKTNFLPVGVNWTPSSQSEYYNIYQKDFYGNLTLIRTLNGKGSSAFALPDIKQRLVNLGVSGFGGLNGTGYYDIVVSGIIPAVTTGSQSVSSSYGFTVGDSDDQLTSRSLQNNNPIFTAEAISNVTYSGILDFYNPELKTENFQLEPKYDGYYFLSSGASATLFGLSNRAFEAYVVSSGLSTITVGGSSVANGQVAAIGNNGSISVSTTKSNPASSLDLGDFDNNQVLQITSDVTITDIGAAAPKTIFVINDSSSSRTITFGASNYSLAANKTAKLLFGPPISLAGSLLDNYEIQNEKIYRPKNSLLNLDHNAIEFGSDTLTSIGVYNQFTDQVSLKNSAGSSVGSLAADSFNVVSWNGSTATVSQKEYFDDIKIYLKGTESEDSLATIVRDDIEIILSYFQPDASSAEKSYFFLKDEESNRDFTIKITNGSSSFFVPRQNQNFKLTVIKIGSQISYSILYPAGDPLFEITNKKEQLVIINQAMYINLDGLKARMRSDSFVYFINKSSGPLNFSNDEFTAGISVAPNQVAKAYIANGSLSIELIGSPRAIDNGVFSRLSFTIDPAVHMVDSTSILDLEFCGTQIKIPSVSNFDGKELFLVCRNRTIPNIIDPTTVTDLDGVIETSDQTNTQEINDIGQIRENSIALRLYRKSVADLYPSIEKIPFIQEISPRSFSKLVIENDSQPQTESSERNFYIDDDDLDSFVLRDFYNRKTPYEGKVFLPSIKSFTLKSFDRNTSFTTQSRSQVLGFDYFPDKFANGRFTIDDSRSARIFNNSTEDGSNTLTTTTDITTDEIGVNFSYSNVIINGVRLNKNRLYKKDYRSNQVFPIYNDEEFFLPRDIDGDRYNTSSTDVNFYFYQILPSDEKFTKIIIPDTLATGTGFIIKNWTTRTIVVQQMSYSGSNYQTTLAPNEQKKITFSGSWSALANTSALPAGTVNISKENQKTQVDKNHPFINFYNTTGIELNDFLEQFIPENAVNNSLTLNINASSYQIVDANSGVIPSGTSRLVCFGRTGSRLEHGSTVLVVNNFYVFLVVDGNIVRVNQFFDINNNQVKSIEVVARKTIDLSKFFKNYAVNSIPDNWLITISDNLETFSLPNLKYGASSSDQSNEFSGIGPDMVGKKIIFVNALDCPTLAANKVYNYSDSTEESLTTLNSIVVYQVVLSGSNYVWQKQTSSLPTVQTVNAKLTGLRGITRTSTSEIALGREFVYLPNIQRFDLDINSFENREFGDILLFNSAINNLEIKSDGSRIGSSRFMKITKNVNGVSFSSTDIGANNVSSFSVVKVTATSNREVTADIINQLYPKLSQGTFIKYVNVVNSVGSSYYFSYNADKVAVEYPIANKDFAVLDAYDLLVNAPNKKLFIYGSIFVSNSGSGFYPYVLKVINIDRLGAEKFYIYNSSSVALQVYFAKESQTSDPSVYIPPKTMLEISSNSARFCEVHEKSAFFISRSRDNVNYLNKLGISFRFDSLSSYQDLLTDLKEVNETTTLNIAVSCLSSALDYVNLSYYNQVSELPSYFTNKTLSLFTKASNFTFTANDKPAEQIIINPIVTIPTANPGHYIFNTSSIVIKALNPSSSSTFLVNNTPENILVISSNGNKILYRNSVLVIASSGSVRYLKKAKNKDEFYCVFSTNTAISTQREITLGAGIPRSYDVLPILDEQGVAQQSYVKILGKNGGSSYVYLSLRDYYNGKDIPTNTPENAVAYEVGIGHETIYKFLFYNPQDSAYTMPGIGQGLQYLVEIDDALYRDLANLPGLGGEVEPSLLEPVVKYNGVEYRNGETFFGTDNPNYEVRYPNYVKIYRVVYEVDKVYPRQGADSKPSETQFEGTSSVENVAQDTKALLIEAINANARSGLGTPITWCPLSYEAFWSSSSTQKDVWIVQEVIPTQSISIAYPAGTTTSYANFVKCKVKKLNFRSPIFNYSYDFYSAFQQRSEIADPRDLVIAFDSELSPAQRNTIRRLLNEYENREDYLLNIKDFNLGGLSKPSLFIQDPKVVESVKDSDFELSISVSKLETLPSIKFDDVSKQGIIKIINGE